MEVRFISSFKLFTGRSSSCLIHLFLAKGRRKLFDGDVCVCMCDTCCKYFNSKRTSWFFNSNMVFGSPLISERSLLQLVEIKGHLRLTYVKSENFLKTITMKGHIGYTVC